MSREDGELLDHPYRPAIGAVGALVRSANELLEVALALHAHVLVDRHRLGSVDMGPDIVFDSLATTLQGRIVVLEPLTEAHREGLWEAAASDPRIWDWMSVRAGDDRGRFDAWFDEALALARRGPEVPFATLAAADREPIGSTRYLNLRPEHRVLEIGWTWLASHAWSTGANAEAKYLLLRHAFEDLHCKRVEFKTDALNERSRRALAALPAEFEGIHRKHMIVRAGERRDSAWYAVVDDDWPAVRATLEQRLANRRQ